MLEFKYYRNSFQKVLRKTHIFLNSIEVIGLMSYNLNTFYDEKIKSLIE